MSKQIAVRLADDLVDFVDEIVGSGQEPSRAAVVARALERERRRVVAGRDAAIPPVPARIPNWLAWPSTRRGRGSTPDAADSRRATR
jgi:Arc/MetJ-type ribon-helix-helix transcriptional regulator